jgi:hypothetical protein
VKDFAPQQETRLSLAIVLAIILAQAIVCAPELTTASYRNTDAVSHFALIKGMADAAARGDNPLDFWSAETSLGVPLARLYQPLAHFLVVAVYFALGKTVSVWTVFLWAKYLSMILLPLAFYAAARMLDLPPLTSAAIALLMPMISGPGPGQLGMDLRSWIGFGLYPQAVGASLLLLAIGLSYRATRTGKYVIAAGAVIGLTLIAHLIYGWMGALTACLIAVMPMSGVARVARIRRLVMMGVAAAVVAMFQLLPIVTDGYLINRARSEPAEKYDSYGASKVLRWLFSGELMDHGRLPVLTVLLFLGAGLLLWQWRKTQRMEDSHRFLLLGSAFWLLVFFGKPTWGPLLILIGVTRDLHLHRVIGVVQVFLVFLAGIGLAWLWREASRRWRPVSSVVLTLLLLAPMAIERVDWIERHTDMERPTYADVQREGPALEQAIATAKQRGGRVFAGLRGTWGPRFLLGAAPVYEFLTTSLTPTITDAYNQTALPSDLIGRFDQSRASEYRVFNIRTLITPPVSGIPEFLKPLGNSGRFQMLAAPGEGYFGLVDVAAAADTTRDNFVDLCDPWLHSDWPDKNQYIWLDFHGEAPRDLPRVTPGPLPVLAGRSGDSGKVMSERQAGQVYEADVEVSRPSWALFRMTYHPAWKMLVDGRQAKTIMVSPGELATSIGPGRHHLICRYESGNMKWVLLAIGWGLALVGVVIEDRRARRLPH